MRRLLATPLALLACTPPEGACAPGDAPVLQLGTGVEVFEPLDDGAEVELVHGPQGGFHVVVSFRATHLDTRSGRRLAGRVTGRIDGELVADTTPNLEFRCQPDASSQDALGGLLVFASTPEALDGQTVDIHAEVTDEAGTTTTADLTALIHDPLLESP